MAGDLMAEPETTWMVTLVWRAYMDQFKKWSTSVHYTDDGPSALLLEHAKHGEGEWAVLSAFQVPRGPFEAYCIEKNAGEFCEDYKEKD